MQYLRKIIIPVVQHLKDAITNIHRTANPLHVDLRIQQVVPKYYCSAISAKNNSKVHR